MNWLIQSDSFIDRTDLIQLTPVKLEQKINNYLFKIDHFVFHRRKVKQVLNEVSLNIDSISSFRWTIPLIKKKIV